MLRTKEGFQGDKGVVGKIELRSFRYEMDLDVGGIWIPMGT